MEDLRAMPIRGATGNMLRLGDIAEIGVAMWIRTAVKVRHEGQEVIALGVSMAKGGDIIALGKACTRPPRRCQDLACGRATGAVQDQPKLGGQFGQ
jgi:multidrug efflux pump